MGGEQHEDQQKQPDQQQPEQSNQKLWTPDQEIGTLVSGFPFHNESIRMLHEMHGEENLERFVDWLDDLEKRFGFSDLFVEYDPVLASAMKNVKSILDELKSRISFLILSCEKGLAIDRKDPEYNALLKFLCDNELNIDDIVFAAYKTGIMDIDGNVRIEEFCAGGAFVSAVIARIRGKMGYGKTFANCWESDLDDYGLFEASQDLIAEEYGSLNFVNKDIKKFETIKTNEGDVIWISKYPDDMINHIIDMAVSLDPESAPNAVIIIPCNCHCYDDESYPSNGDESVISRLEWKRLKELMDVRQFLFKNDFIKSKARHIMDCFRVYSANARQSHLDGKVFQSPRQKGTVLIFKKSPSTPSQPFPM